MHGHEKVHPNSDLHILTSLADVWNHWDLLGLAPDPQLIKWVSWDLPPWCQFKLMFDGSMQVTKVGGT